MKKLLVVTFAVSTLLRPSLVLCMEQTGDVRLELQESVCCESERAPEVVAFNARPADDCDGCVDVSLLMHSLALKRMAPPAPPAVSPLVLPLVTASAHTAFQGARGAAHPFDIHALVLSTTVIRC